MTGEAETVPAVDPPPRAEADAPRRARGAWRLLLSEYSVFFLALAYFLGVWPFVPEIGSGENLSNLLSGMLPLLALAIGQTVVLVAGGIDLSVTATVGLASVAGAWVMNGTNGLLGGSPWAVPAAIALMVLIGIAVGLLNGVAITAFNMPAFIVTLTMMMLVGGSAVYATRSRNIRGLPEGFLALAWTPYAALVVGFVALGTHLMLSRTLAGRWLYATGMNPRASAVSGVPVRRVVVFAYCVSGACAAAASVIRTAQMETGKPTIADRMLLDVVGAAVIGGTSLFGGKGKVVWTAFGVLLLALVDNSLVMFNLSSPAIMMVKGGIILLAALADQVRTRILAGGLVAP
jgi:ribose transport system permease protein